MAKPKIEVVVDNTPYQPSADYVLVRIKPVDEKTPGGILMPDVVKDRQRNESQFGEVMGIGPEAFDRGEPWFRVGDKVVVAKHAFTFVPDSKDLVLMRDVDVLAVAS